MIPPHISKALEDHYRDTNQTDLLERQIHSNRLAEVIRTQVNSCDCSENRHIQFTRTGTPESIEARIIARTEKGLLGEVLSNVSGTDILVNRGMLNILFGPCPLTRYSWDEQKEILDSINPQGKRTVEIDNSSGHTQIIISNES